jgi:putative phage-type endonuclease
VIEQRTPEWFAQRKGKLTASNFAQALAVIGSRQELWRDLTGKEKRWFNEDAVNWGTTLEATAIEQFEIEHPYLIVGRDGFCAHPEIEWLGGSPDGIVFDVGSFDANGNSLLEVKCPYSQKLWGAPPDYYIPQVQGLMEIKNLPSCLFMCWTPVDYRVWLIKRSTEYWEWMLPKLAEFWTYVEFDVEPPRFARGEKFKFNGKLEIERWH